MTFWVGLQTSQCSCSDETDLEETDEHHCHQLQSWFSSDLSIYSIVGLPAHSLLVMFSFTFQQLQDACFLSLSLACSPWHWPMVTQVCGVKCCPIIFSLSRNWNADMAAIKQWIRTTSSEERCPVYSVKGHDWKVG